MSSERDDASAKAELAALVDAVESCRSRLTALAERRNAAARGKDVDADSLLIAIYEAERGLSTAIRLLQRAVRSAR
jgi:flagellar hook-basal body complex protein FliE